MHIPEAYLWDDPSAQFAFCRDHPFATVVHGDGRAVSAQHLPVLIDGPPGDPLRWQVATHVALANPLRHSERALAIFQGPHAYVSAGWYDADDVVPTWNYLTVHLQLRLEQVTDPTRIGELFARAARRWDDHAAAWQARLSDQARDRLSNGIRWLTGTVESIDAKAKLSQNHDEERRRRVIARLRHLPDQQARATASAMRQTLHDGPVWPV